MELNCPVKQYAWGKKGSDSLVAQLKQCGDPNFRINENEMYAELWMGTHSSGAAMLKDSNTSLDKWLKNNVSKLGDNSVDVFGTDLPFLFKILSVNIPLSIQCHPSKSEAQQLHAQFPDIYTDPNHKPEIAIALSTFEILCGFRAIIEIRYFLERIPELVELIGQAKVMNFLYCNEMEYMEHLQVIFSILMHAPAGEVQKYLNMFLDRVAKEDSDSQNKVLFDLICRIAKYFPGDVGCFCIYFLNHIILRPGEWTFLECNQPHAYLSGDCVECMSRSDNVIRAALTSKHRDVDTLCKLLNYTPSDGRSRILHAYTENNNSVLYKPPVQEFAVCRVEIGSGLHYLLKCRTGPSIFIVLQGHGVMGNVELSRGKVFFIGAREVHSIHVSLSSENLLLFQAFVNV